MPVVNRDIERQIVIQGREQGMSDAEIKKFVVVFRKNYKPEQVEKSRGTMAKEAFFGSFKSAGSKLKRAAESFGEQSLRGQVNPLLNPRASMSALGAVGDIVASPLAAATGLAQPELQRGVEFAIEKTPEKAKEFIGEQVGKLSEEDKQFAGDTLSATSLFLLSGMGKQGAKEVGKQVSRQTAKKGIVRTAIKKTGKVIESSGKKSASSAKASFLDDLVRPKETVKTATEAARRSTQVGKVFKRTITELSPDEKAAKAALMKVKGIKPRQTAQKVLDQANDEVRRQATALTKHLAKKDVIFPKQELRAFLKKAASRLDDNINIGADSKGAVDKMMKKVLGMIDDTPAKGSSLLKTRKAFDKWVKGQKGDLFGGNDTAIKVANKEIRNTLNKFLATKAKGTPVASSLRNQSNLMRAIEQLAPKAGAEAKNMFGRAFQNIDKAIGKNKTIKEIVGLLAIGGTFATGTAPLAAGLTGGYFSIKGLTSLVKNPQNRILLGKLIQELSKVEAKGIAVAELNALKQNIQTAITSQPL